MKSEELSEQERQLLNSLHWQLRKAKREGALMGSLYSVCAASLLYTAIVNLGPLHPVSALCYGGVVVLAVDAWRRLFSSD